VRSVASGGNQAPPAPVTAGVVRRAFALFLPVALAATVLAFGTGYGLTQQALRDGANDPQTAMALDAVAALDSGAGASSVVAASQVDLSHSLAPWVAVYDSSRHLLASSASDVDSFPTSVFDSVPAGGRDNVTWQPDPSVRQATVVVRWSHGWVVAGRSLHLVEQRESQTLLITVAGWAAALVATAAGAAGGALVQTPSRPPA
jgi:hypothetical protein